MKGTVYDEFLSNEQKFENLKALNIPKPVYHKDYEELADIPLRLVTEDKYGTVATDFRHYVWCVNC